MATRSRIAIEKQDGTVDSIYCHFDGYLEGVGKMLFENYDRESTQQLIDLGNILELGETSLSYNGTIAYHRDMEKDIKRTIYIDVEELFEMNASSGVEYVYCLTKDNRWLVSRGGPVADLSLALKGEDVL